MIWRIASRSEDAFSRDRAETLPFRYFALITLISCSSSRQAKDEIYNCPPALLIIGRADDGWLATWSRADAVVSHPIDPIVLAHELAGLMRERPAVSS